MVVCHVAAVVYIDGGVACDFAISSDLGHPWSSCIIVGGTWEIEVNMVPLVGIARIMTVAHGNKLSFGSHLYRATGGIGLTEIVSAKTFPPSPSLALPSVVSPYVRCVYSGVGAKGGMKEEVIEHLLKVAV
jgi:hypothetical protein